MQRLYDLVYLTTTKTQLGESPVWHPNFNKFYWTDFYGNKLVSLDLQSHGLFEHTLVEASMPNLDALSIAPTSEGFVAAFSDRIGTID